MTGRAITDWDAEQDLAAMLDALTAELLVVPACDIAALLRQTGEPVEATAESMRRLVAAVDAYRIAPHVWNALAVGLRASIARNQ
jgi:hypothetical protein